MKILLFFLLTGCCCLFNEAIAQNHGIAQFVVWKPKEGQGRQFENGYKQHLNWHKNNGDTWNWYGWFFINGPHDGYFMDATFDHAWSDFDKPNKPAEDGADNQLHVYPFGDVISVCKVNCLHNLSITDTSTLRSKYMRMITLRLEDVPLGIKLIEKLKTGYQQQFNGRHFTVYQVVDGGHLNDMILLMGFGSFDEFGKSVQLLDQLPALEASFKTKIIGSITSETLVYRADMSLIGL